MLKMRSGLDHAVEDPLERVVQSVLSKPGGNNGVIMWP